MTITETSKVEVNYIGTLNDGTIFDTSIEEVARENNLFNEQREYAPLSVEMGKGQVIPGFENALLGMKSGEKKTVKIESKDAYGDRNEELIIEVPDDSFKQNNLEPQIGMVLQTSQGMAVVVGVNEEANKVTMDFNHPMAGNDLTFELEVVKID
ncbi:MAG: peptidylprolyl isomerase [Candidatus Heimdallarchaeota archaeon]|nr:peptidylprolyl isomerase [Candidatus Heimdallarchaeota archaeon]